MTPVVAWPQGGERLRGKANIVALAYVRTPDGRRRTISNNVAPWAGWLRRPRGEPRPYLANSTVASGDS